eukprot:7868841-Pyramimonas_sp.AAC.1
MSSSETIEGCEGGLQAEGLSHRGSQQDRTCAVEWHDIPSSSIGKLKPLEPSRRGLKRGGRGTDAASDDDDDLLPKG